MLSILITLAILAGATWQSRQLQTGDVGSGVPELRAESATTRTTRASSDYSIGMDVLSVYGNRGHEACLNWEVMNAVERFDLHMRGVVGVQSVSTVAGLAKLYVAGNNGPTPLGRPAALRSRPAHRAAPPTRPGPEHLRLQDHQPAGHSRTTRPHPRPRGQGGAALHRRRAHPRRALPPGGGNAGVAAATNEAVEHAEIQMLASIFGAITLLCWITFRSWRAVLCVIVPW
jgi:hypothetical protein